MFLGQPFLIFLKCMICYQRPFPAARRQQSLIQQYKSQGTQDKIINPCLKQLFVKA